MIRRAAASILVGLTLTAGMAAAATSWVSVKDLDGGQAVCLRSGGGQFEYRALVAGDEATCTVDGPRRVKIVSRYMFADSDAKRVPYDVTVSLDGRQILSKASTGRPHADYVRCDDGGRVGSLRRAYVDVPAGRHHLVVRTATAGAGEVALRVFREVRRKRERWVAFAPASYDEIRTLQFESGAQSRYYHFDAGELTSAVYLERADILPGVRREARIDVPRGRHRVTVRCVRPEACGIAAMVHIPKSDLER
jgi:hypothetical protein